MKTAYAVAAGILLLMNDISCIFIVDMTFNTCNFKIVVENCFLGKCVWIEHKHYNMPMRRQKRWPREPYIFCEVVFHNDNIVQKFSVSHAIIGSFWTTNRQTMCKTETRNCLNYNKPSNNIAIKTKLGAIRNHVDQGCGFLHRLLETNLMHFMCINENESCVPNVHYTTAIIVFSFATRLFDL